jgi:hypothetical protein
MHCDSRQRCGCQGSASGMKYRQWSPS